MLVLKFGGTSVGKPERMRKIADLLLSTPGKKIVVLSALSGTTNTLVKIGDHLLSQSPDELRVRSTTSKNITNFLLKICSQQKLIRLSARRS